ncbi:SGNH/GDSL hydrolase family protein [Streptomyces sp. NBC_00988]|uniref:SGNH/GDSL hydrolase family protein n=1 Tax=Streptomyces sp. NBC_00988 TaxID=2903704 RepID=UPI00386647A2|nr:SGNH/GDSL hydrolase family protein [Streptomyces sp. NBC_00988]
MTLAVAASGPAAAMPALGDYVALGDSYVAGPGIPETVSGSGICARSDHNYPSLVARATDPTTFTDVSCSGAVTDDMTGRQLGIAPQFDALTSDTGLVTLTIGGNDAGFAGIVVTCVVLSFSDPTGAPCEKNYNSGGTDQILQKLDEIAPKVGAVIQGIHQRSPHARVAVVGYPDLLPAAKSKCAVDVPVATGDVPYLNSVEQRLNRLLSAQAAANGAEFVDTYASSVGHDLCQAPGTRWVEGLQDVQDAAPIHPNALGMANTAAQVLSGLR